MRQKVAPASPSLGTDQFTDPTSDPIGRIDTAREAVFAATGRYPNVISVEHRVANALRRHPAILDIAKAKLNGGAASTGALSEGGLVETLKAWFNFDDVIIPRGVKITSKEGQTETKGAVWNKDIVVFYRPSGPSLFTPSFGYSFQLSGYNLRSVVRREPVADKGDEVEVMWAYQDKVLDTNSAYLIKSAA